MDYQKLIRALLANGDRHSAAYVAGMHAALQLRIDDVATSCPHQPGTPEFDAFYYGCCRGADEFRNALIEANGDRGQALARLENLSNQQRAA